MVPQEIIDEAFEADPAAAISAPLRTLLTP